METFHLVFIFFSVLTYGQSGPPGQPCFLSVSTNISDGLINGSVIIKDNIEYQSANYFVINNTIYGCTCNIKKCIRKCCGPQEIMSNSQCITTKENFSISLHRETEFLRDLYVSNTTLNVNDSYHYIYKTCSPNNSVLLDAVSSATDKFYVQEDGRLSVPNLGLSNNPIGVHEYCVDIFDEPGMKLSYSAIYCTDEETESRRLTKIGNTSNVTGMMISMPFLLATFLVYAILPDHNIHKKALMYYVMSLFMAYVFLVCIQLPTTEYSEASCTSLGVFCIFFFLLSFFWMNVICVDMFLGFRGFRGFSGNKSSEKKRFIWYNVYAWGMSLTITIVIIIINQAGNPDKWFHPNLGIGQCYIRDGLPLLIYFYMPMGLLITVNLALFIFTALKIRQVKKETKVLRKGDSKRHSDDNDKQKFNLYLKLLFAMGVNWSMEIVSWAVSYKYQQSIPSYVWYLTDFCNASYGVFIFFIFVFKKSVWKQLQRRYYAFRGKQHLAHSMTTTNQTASSAVDTNRNSDDQEMALSSTR